MKTQSKTNGLATLKNQIAEMRDLVAGTQCEIESLDMLILNDRITMEQAEDRLKTARTMRAERKAKLASMIERLQRECNHHRVRAVDARKDDTKFKCLNCRKVGEEDILLCRHLKTHKVDGQTRCVHCDRLDPEPREKLYVLPPKPKNTKKKKKVKVK